MDKDYYLEASLAHLSKKATEAKAQDTGDWIQRHVKAERRYIVPPAVRLLRRIAFAQFVTIGS